MTTREQGRRTVRALTTALAVAGVIGTGGLGAAAYTGITSSQQQAQTGSGSTAASTASGDDAGTPAGTTSGTSSGVGAATGSTQTGSSGS